VEKKAGADLNKEQLLALYRQMLVIRYCEERLVKSYQAGMMFGGCHTYIGEEAIATGVIAHLREDDVVFSTHRGHGHALAKGLSPRELIAELYGKATGCAGGRGGSMHLFKPKIGLMGTSGIVSPSILLASGAAYKIKLAQEDRVSVSFFGDGAVPNGAFHEGINLATLWELPVVFVCENNLYATELFFSDAMKNTSVASRAQIYGLPGVEVDGNDVIAVYEAAGAAIDRARSGGGPTLLECKTYRTRPHAEGQRTTGYRTREEIEEWQRRCPIRRFREKLVTDEVAAERELDEIEAQVEAVVEDAHKFAMNSPYPDPATVLDHVYSVEC